MLPQKLEEGNIEKANGSTKSRKALQKPQAAKRGWYTVPDLAFR
jgi:hypothetical protein